ncbi:MAG: toxin-antitoxin system, antitoxin component, Xre family protein [Butyricicoccaceae bacterium]
MTDTAMLKSKIAGSGLKIGYVIDKIGISYQCFLNKLHNKSDFKAREIQILCEVLSLSNAEKEAIFFAPAVE